MQNEAVELEMKLRKLSDQALDQSARDAVRAEKKCTLAVLVHLREIERRKTYFTKTTTSLFAYAVDELKYAGHEANRRISAMRLMKEMPELEEKLKTGSLNLTNLNQAQGFFSQEARSGKPMSTEEKKDALSAIEGKTTRQADIELLKRSTNPEAQIKRRESNRPVTPTRTELKIYPDEEMNRDLEQLRGFVANRMKNPSLGDVVKFALKTALDQVDPARKKTRRRKPESSVAPTAQKVETPEAKDVRQGKPESFVVPTARNVKTPAPKIVPAGIPSEPGDAHPQPLAPNPDRGVPTIAQKRELFRQAGSRCTRIDPESGQRCVLRGHEPEKACPQCGPPEQDAEASRYQLQCDHIIPFAKGGPTELWNLRVLCIDCHRRETFRVFGASEPGLHPLHGSFRPPRSQVRCIASVAPTWIGSESCPT